MNVCLLTIILVLFLATPADARADKSPYSDTIRIVAESQNLRVIHFHDWTESTSEARDQMMRTDQDPFTTSNTYSYLECIDKSSDKVLFRRPCPALHAIEISKDERFIVGISNIKYQNPYQLVVFSANGDLLKKRHVASSEARLTSDQLEHLARAYPMQFAKLKEHHRVYVSGDTYFIDFDVVESTEKAWDYLIAYMVDNHLSENFVESVTNSITWYYESKPEMVLDYSGNELVSISLLDPERQRFVIQMNE